MKPLDVAETRELVGLFRKLSPLDFVPEPALPPPWLAGLRNAYLPRRPKALLFDLYGTLFASAAGGEPATTRAAISGEGETARLFLEEELHACGHIAGASAFAEVVARRIVALRREALEGRPFPEIDIEEIVESIVPGSAASVRRLALLFEAWSNPCAPMPGALALLERLRGGAIRLGIVSNAQFYTPLLFEALFGAPPADAGFETILTIYSCDAGIAKPDPSLFSRAAAPLLAAGIAAGEILVVGNSAPNDIAPAKALGFMTALFAGDGRSFRPAPADTRGRPDSLIDGLDLLDASFPTA